MKKKRRMIGRCEGKVNALFLDKIFADDKEEKTAMILQADDIAYHAFIICSDWLNYEPTVWAYANQELAKTDYEPLFIKLNKSKCQELYTLGLFQTGGYFNLFDIHNTDQFLDSVDFVVNDYNNAMEYLAEAQKQGNVSEEDLVKLANKKSLPANVANIESVLTTTLGGGDGGNTKMVEVKTEYKRDENMDIMYQ